MIEQVTAWQSSDGSVWKTENLAMRQNTKLALTNAKVGSAFGVIFDNAHSDRPTRDAFIAFGKALEEMYK